MTRKGLSLVASAGLVTLFCVPPRASAQVSPSLGTAGTYSILAGSQVTNTGATTISGDVGVSPGIGAPPHYTGFGTVVLGGMVHDADAAALAAQGDKNTAYGALDQGCTVTYAGAFKELAGSTLVPGVYCATSFHLTSGTLTLAGLASNTWIFKSSSDLIVTGGAASRVVSPSCNVWWRVVSSATFDAGSSLIGNILADTSITLAAGASLGGRALARTAAVTLSSNTVSACTVSVPTLPEWAFIMLAVLLAAAGAVALRKHASA
jgi:ice-binding like protein/exosortase sorting signal-containing protein